MNTIRVSREGTQKIKFTFSAFYVKENNDFWYIKKPPYQFFRKIVCPAAYSLHGVFQSYVYL